MALVVPAVLILAGWLVLAIIHIDDRYEVGHGQGVWMALARGANVAGLYPELFDGTSYGGTRYMPLPILAHATLARLTGEYITSGKLLGLFATAGMVIVTFAFLRSIGCRWTWALALSALPVGGFAGLRAGTTIGGEPLPVMFGVAALAIVIRSQRRLGLILAALLVACGISAKLTALWAPVAIVAWLFLQDRRRAALFAAYSVGATALMLAAFNLMSNGRMVENLVAASGAGLHGTMGLLGAPARLLGYVVEGEPAVWAFVPALVYAAAMKRWPTSATLLALAWLAAAGLLLIIFADVGTGPNQLVDLAVLTSLCVGAIVAFANPAEARQHVLVMVLTAMVVWSGITAFTVRVRPPLQDALAAVVSDREPYPRDVLAVQLSHAGSVLSEDPGLLVEQERIPVVLDPFVLRKLAETRPADVERLISRIDAQEFDLVVLEVPLEDPNDGWWHDYHFGTEVMTAVSGAYRFDQRVGPYHLYRPRS